MIVDQRIGYVDFGLVASLKPGLRKRIRELVFALATKDVDKLARVIYSIAIKKGKIDYHEFSMDVDLVYHRYITDTLGDIDSKEFLSQVLALARKHKLATPREVILLLKVLGTLEGFVREFIPDMEPTDVFAPYFKKKFLADFNIRNEAGEQFASLVTLLRNSTKIPQKFHELMGHMVGGRLRIHIELADLDEILQVLRAMTNRIGTSLIIAALIIGASIMASAAGGRLDHHTLAILGFVAAGFLALFLWLTSMKR